MEKGIAFPTCISLNNCVGHHSPLPESEGVLKENDVIKIDLGVHLDGYIAVAAQTVPVLSPPSSSSSPSSPSPSPLTGPAANAIAAAYYASEIGLLLFLLANLLPWRTIPSITSSSSDDETWKN